MWSKVVALLGMVAAARAILEGPNVCTRQEPYTTKIRVSEQQPYQVKEYTWCFSVPPRCSKYKIKFQQVFKTQILVKYRPVEECCTGFAPDEAGQQCVPVCATRCVQGKCVAPNTCACDHGYGGPACDISCPKGKWGRNCQNECQCLNGGTCEPLSGECACAPGWRGDSCERACAPPTFGDNCAETCQCRNNATCDAASGACDCWTGFTGPLCEERCSDDGPCPQKCRCQNNGKCNVITGECDCTPGWTGEVCANRCPAGKWGAKCGKSCECANGASCHHVTGHCHCESGYTGEKCVETCPLGTFGIGCAGKCLCEHGGECSNKDGSCTCKPGWKGERCELRACEEGKYGPRCEKDCECNPTTTDLCDPFSGACDCAAGWGGETCLRQCPLLTYGKGCRAVCRCENSGLCSPVNGSCLCAPGYRGQRCEEQCPFPSYGDNCRDKCDCRNNATCSHETGQCVCLPGYDGLKCDRPCDGKTYGLNCREACSCENNAPCDPVTGQCICPPGYHMSRCEQKCPVGFFGQGCQHPCNCSENARGCHHITGQCICESSWRDAFGSTIKYDIKCGEDYAMRPLQDATEVTIKNKVTVDPNEELVPLKRKKSIYKKSWNNLTTINTNKIKRFKKRRNKNKSLIEGPSLTQCISWSVYEKPTYDSILAHSTQLLSSLNIHNPEAIVAVLNIEESVLTGRTAIWGVTIEDGRMKADNMYFGNLLKLTGQPYQ